MGRRGVSVVPQNAKPIVPRLDLTLRNVFQMSLSARVHLPAHPLPLGPLVLTSQLKPLPYQGCLL